MPFVDLIGLKRDDYRSTIWRYVDFPKFVSMLETRSLYFTRADNLLKLDPYEGHFDEFRILQKYKKYPDTYKKMEDHARNEFPKNLFVNCWHMNENESDAMWKVYASNDKGIAIQSSLWNLIHSSKNSPEKIRAGKVEYIDHEKQITSFKDLHQRFLLKGISYKHENEIRLLVFKPSQGGKLGMNIFVDLTALIEKIYISPMSPDWFVTLVKSIAMKYGINEKLVEKSKLYTKPEPKK